MTESVLKALMRLFAIVANIVKEEAASKAKIIVESYLNEVVNQDKIQQFTVMFDYYYRSIKQKESRNPQKKLSLYSVKVLAICEQINEELLQKQKILVLLQLLEVIKYESEINAGELDFVKTVADSLKVNEDEFYNCKAFILDSLDEIFNKEQLLIVDSNYSYSHPKIKHIYKNYINGQIILLRIVTTNTYVFRYVGKDDLLLLNGREILPNRTYLLEKGAAIKSHKTSAIYYSDVVSKFLNDESQSQIFFSAENISYIYKGSDAGIHRFNFSAQSGQLIGIMGGSGAGKSTVLNVLNGNIVPQEGRVFINGQDISQDNSKIKGVIGYIPQDDLLIEELTVFQNLHFNARLCFDSSNDEEIMIAVNKALNDLDLYEIRNLPVGNPLNKLISGGQRKRLNIALELIREPSILFVDEPTSGLSSSDSEKVMDLLKEQTLKGKLLIVNIHQPSSDIFKLFDNILFLDKGGYPIFFGNPLDSVIYFKSMSHYVNANESECLICGNVNPEQVLQLVEAKDVNNYGEITNVRKVSPKDWYELYIKNIDGQREIFKDEELLPENNFSVPNRWKQFKIFFLRNIFTKITDSQYLLINGLESPLLAIILAVLTKYLAGNESNPNAYIFSKNVNLPSYLFMSVIVSLFLGMMVSAEEIIKDRKILQRESFLHLSKFSYINSKVLLLFIISAIQTICFIVLGNAILGIKGMTISYWLILFSTSCFANLIGLNISASLNSVVSIYILIPLLLVPQLLLSGVIVKFDKLHKSVNSQLYVPFIGDVMPSRWAYEALVVEQFKNNAYEKYYFNIEEQESQNSYIINYLIPELQSRIDECETNVFKNKRKNSKTENDFEILRNEFKDLQLLCNMPSYKHIDKLCFNSFTGEMADQAYDYLARANKIFTERLDKITNQKDNITTLLVLRFKGKENYIRFKNTYFNQSLSDLVQNKQEETKLVEHDKKLVRTYEPIFKIPENTLGRALFFSPVKQVAGINFDTLWFNIFAIWFISMVLYFCLLGDGLRKSFAFVKNVSGYLTEYVLKSFKPRKMNER